MSSGVKREKLVLKLLADFEKESDPQDKNIFHKNHSGT